MLNFIFQLGKKCILALKVLVIASILLILSLFSLGLLLYLTTPDVTFLANSNPSTTAFIELSQLKAKQEGTLFNLQWKWVPLSDISPALVQSVVKSEDTTFWKHDGVEWNQVKYAFRTIWHQHRIVTGGSTITQQVAKNLYLYPEQTLFRKCRELFIAFELERYLSKERILEIYLNIAEWGNGIFGVEAASLHWYNCHANELTPKQAASLALTLPNPKARNPTNLSPRLSMYVNQLILLLARDGVISDEMAIESLNIPFDDLDEESVYIIVDH